MNVLIDFFGSQAGVELLRIADSVLNIVAAIISGVALRNISQVKKAVGGAIGRPLRQTLGDLLHRKKHATSAEPDLKLDAFQSLTLAQKVDMLKDNQEILWLRQGVESESVKGRLDRVDPPTRKH
jgi:hypothetical protein